MEIGGNTNSNGAITDEIPVSKMSINDSTWRNNTNRHFYLEFNFCSHTWSVYCIA